MVKLVDLPVLGTLAGTTRFFGANAGSGAVTLDMMRDYLAPMVSVKLYGAKGDGVTDDYAAIQAALNTGKSVFFPPGHYICGTDQTLVFSAEGQGMYGSGRRGSVAPFSGTTLRFNGTSTLNCIEVGTPSTLARVNRISDMEIRAPNRLGGYLIWARNSYRLKLDNLYLTYGFNGYGSADALGTCLSDVLILDVRGDYGVAAFNLTGTGAGDASDILELLHVTVAPHATIRDGAGGVACTGLLLDNTGSVLMHGFKALSGCGWGLRAVRTGTPTSGGGFINAHLFAVEFPTVGGVDLQAGHRWNFVHPYIFGCAGTANPGLRVGPNVTNVVITGGDIAANKGGGVVIEGTGVSLQGTCVALNGTSGDHDGITIASTAQNVRLTGCQIGERSNATGGQAYGVKIDAAAQYVGIANCDFQGNATGAISDTAGVASLAGNFGVGTLREVQAPGLNLLDLGNQGQTQLRVGNSSTTTVANNLRVAGGAAGAAPQIIAEGETNVDIRLTPAGTGLVQLTSSTAATTPGSFTADRYIAVKDTSGTIRYIPCRSTPW